MKVVLDSNVIIAAFASQGLCHVLFEHCLENHEIILCEEILAEVSEKLRLKIKLPQKTVGGIDRYLRFNASIVEPEVVDPQICRDINDLMVIGAALAARAAYIITGDNDLLTIDSFKDVLIVNPRRFWDEMRRLGTG